jgi:hypothetical protein
MHELQKNCTAVHSATILRNGIEPVAEGLIEYQAGFRCGRSTMDRLFTVKQILEKCWEYNVNVYQL